NPLLLAAADRIEFILEFGGEVVVDILGEVPGQELGHGATDVGGAKTAAVQKHVVTVEQGLDDAGVSRWATDAEFFQRLDQAGLGIAWWWFGEVLPGDDF